MRSYLRNSGATCLFNDGGPEVVEEPELINKIYMLAEDTRLRRQRISKLPKRDMHND